MSNGACCRRALKDVLGWGALVFVVLSFVALAIMDVSLFLITHTTPASSSLALGPGHFCLCLSLVRLSCTMYFKCV